MLFDFSVADTSAEDALIQAAPLREDVKHRWSVDSEYGRLTDVLVSPPPHLEIMPCNSVAVDALARGLECCAETAERQHEALIDALRKEGVRCATVPATEKLPDLSFTRDAVLMTPWGLLALRPGAEHRRAEVEHVVAHARGWGVPYLGAIETGIIEGGDVCFLRPGLVAIGWSGERTSKEGALALKHVFESRGWQAILTHFDSYFLHLDTLFTMIDAKRAVACIEALDPAFIGQVKALGIEILPVTPFEVQRLGTNLLSLGERRILSSADNVRINMELMRLGYRVIAVDIDQFTRCGGGVHCLTQPLARMPG
ncbi:MAG TPA: arginine deiminase family protein [Allosphingosinicella sp.]|uniref:dimethylarginine dimethylaminohydrolase family protein n=1 Tax=Allosphingosinicella sp. TaxID=2823234 RepID=UPI002ED85C60